MPTNKNAQIRYQALDKCLGNWGRRYYIEDLIEACNEALYIYNGSSNKGEGVKKRQVQEDLKFIESEEGYGMDIDAIRDGHRKYYRYHTKGASIKNQPINQEELNLIYDALILLKRFDGVPQFEWLNDLEKRLYTTSKLGDNLDSVVSFQHNPYLKGMDLYYKPIFNAIVNKRVIEIIYHPFGKDARIVIVTPYHLKQYNNRWFLFGYNETFDSISNFSLDRIIDIKELRNTYIENTKISFDEFFDDIVGVTIKENETVEKILLQITNELWPYVESKPIHGSQTVKEINENYVTIELTLKINYEFISLIFALGEQLKVIQPENLKTAIISKAKNLLKNYF